MEKPGFLKESVAEQATRLSTSKGLTNGGSGCLFAANGQGDLRFEQQQEIWIFQIVSKISDTSPYKHVANGQQRLYAVDGTPMPSIISAEVWSNLPIDNGQKVWCVANGNHWEPIII